MANFIGGETAYRVVNNAMDVFGGFGYSRELPLERYLRDVKAIQIANATLKMEIGPRTIRERIPPLRLNHSNKEPHPCLPQAGTERGFQVQS